ncbi:ClpP family protease [Actinocorallia longicatena]|uniref:ATP-dependent Clp protease proteolytic subunit n=1 Tax=Actinocorallia longicatena TaxID=111803 RepID=A0ABP6QI18_9ACTN
MNPVPGNPGGTDPVTLNGVRPGEDFPVPTSPASMSSWPPELPFPRPGLPQRPETGPERVYAPIRVEPFESGRLMELRTLMVHGHLDGARATELSSRLMTLDALGGEPVKLHLRTPTADLDAAFAVIDTLDVITCHVHAVATGEVGGPALAVLAACTRREMTRHALLRLEEPRERFEGNAHDLAAHERNLARLTEAFYGRLAEVTGRTAEEIRADSRPSRTFTTEEALAYGLVHDAVLRPTRLP